MVWNCKIISVVVLWCGVVWWGVDITVHLTVVVLVSLNITSSSAHSSDSPVISFLYRAELLWTLGLNRAQAPSGQTNTSPHSYLAVCKGIVDYSRLWWTGPPCQETVQNTLKYHNSQNSLLFLYIIWMTFIICIIFILIICYCYYYLLYDNNNIT